MNDLTEIDLRITGPAETQAHSQTIREGDTVRVGRSPTTGIEIPWDRRISREQADLYFDGHQLHIKCLDDARNPILRGRRAYRELWLKVGDEFRIGETRFTVRESEASTRDSLNQQFEERTPNDVVEDSYSSNALMRIGLSNSECQLEILASLPALIASAQTDEELARRIVPQLLAGIPFADSAVMAQFDDAWLESTAGPEVLTRPLVMHVETRPKFLGELRPSRRLILKALRAQKSLVHIWDSGEGGQRFTVSDGLEWAFCVPLRDAACRGWCIFVAGRLGQLDGTDDAIQGGLRFAELLAQLMIAVRHVRQAEGQQARLNTTFAPATVRAITAQNETEVLAPAERDLTTLHCDVQRTGTKGAARQLNLNELLGSSREMLSIVVGGILDREGTLADFRADAAMGVWGWPIRSPDGPVPACQAALDIARSFGDEVLDQDGLLASVSIGIGIAHGPAIAGQIGPSPQAKIGVYGPTVSRSAQLAVIARQLGVVICVDDVTASWVQMRLKKSAIRVRRLAHIRLDQQESPFDVFELLPPLAEAPMVTDEMIVQHDLANDAIIAGDWLAAQAILVRMPEGDGPASFLLRKMAETSNIPPAYWDGTFHLP